ncbi:hypothetical protein [Streptomyces boninensis]|uniref:hypothetical protein n=1 Tax=Streptomyces boninensis TaxID=2039455 RepID=UPI003B220EDB
MTETSSPPPRWLRVLAHTAALTPVPSGVWRLAMAAGVPTGFAVGSGLHPSEISGEFAAYMVVLSLLAEALALLTLGLVQRWGEAVPAWVPRLGGRRIPPLAAFLPAIAAATVLTAAGILGVVGWTSAENMGAATSPHGAAFWVMTLAYAPLVLWGPLLGVVAIASYRIRRQGGSAAGARVAQAEASTTRRPVPPRTRSRWSRTSSLRTPGPAPTMT